MKVASDWEYEKEKRKFTAKDFSGPKPGKFTASDFENGTWQDKFQSKVEASPVETEPERPSLSKTIGNVGDTIGNIGSSIGTGVKKAANWIGNAGKWLGKNLAAGAADYSNSFYNALQSIGGDKVPGLNKLLDYGDRATEQVQKQGGTDIGSQVVRSIPGAAQSAALAIMSGGTSLAPKLGATGAEAVRQASLQMLKNPAFVNSALQSYGSTYGQARDAGAGRLPAIKAGIMNAIPNAMIEVSGGLEQIPQRAGQGLLKNIGKSALEEAGEEALQYPFEGMAKKASYAPNTPILSTKQDAVINPLQMGQNALVGGLAGGLLGGAGEVSNNVFSKLQRPIPNIQTNADAEPVFYADQYGNITDNIRQVPQLQLPAGPEIQQTSKPFTPDYFTDPYGNTANQMEALPKLLTAPEKKYQDIKLDYKPVSDEFDFLSETQKTTGPQIFKGELDSRDWQTFTDRKSKSISETFPDLKGYIQDEANYLLGEMDSSVKAQRYAVKGGVGQGSNMEWGGVSRTVSPVLEQFLDKKYTYAQIGKALQDIRDGKGKSALAKRVELAIDQGLTSGRTAIDGYQIPPNIDYINDRNAAQGSDILNMPEFDDTENEILGTVGEENFTGYLSQLQSKYDNIVNVVTERLRETDLPEDETNKLISETLGMIDEFKSLESGINAAKRLQRKLSQRDQVNSRPKPDTAGQGNTQKTQQPVQAESKTVKLKLPYESFVDNRERFSANRITPGELSNLNRMGLQPNIVNPLSKLNPPIQQPDYQAAAVERTFPFTLTSAENPLSKLNPPISRRIEPVLRPIQSQAPQSENLSTGQNGGRVQATWNNQPVEITKYAGTKKGKDYVYIRGRDVSVPLDEISFNAQQGQLSMFPDQKPPVGTKEFNAQRRQDLDSTMQGLLQTSDQAKDKAGWRLARETQERNSIDVFGREAGQKINETVFRPVHENEARRTRFVNRYIERVKNLNLTKEESKAVQAFGEGKVSESELSSNVNKAKVKSAVQEFRKIYNELYELSNDVLTKNGYKPVEYRKDYFPHFEDPEDPFVNAMKKLGFKVDNMELPTDIAGITHYFRPGKKWFGNFLRREGDKTTYDALEGFERYINGVSDVIYHTYDIQRLRAFEKAIRYKYAPDTVKKRIEEIESNNDLSYDEKRAAIDEMFGVKQGHLGSYVTNLREYTDTLAGKKSISDRNMEHKLGRGFYNTITNLENQVSRNMVGWNLSSWMTNFIPIAQAGGGIKTKNLLKAAYDTVSNYAKDDGFIDRSTFLTNRKGTERLTETALEKIAKAGIKPMEWVDEFTSQLITRGKYLDEIDSGKSPKEAMRKADAYAAGAIADRSKGALPTAFNTKNPLAKLFTQFQVEVNNQYSFLFKDLPRETKEKGIAWLAGAIMKFMIGSFLYNELYEKMTGRRPTLDPIGSIKRTIESEEPLRTAAEEIGEQTPFVGGVLGGGRLPISAALPDLPGMLQGETTWQKEIQKPLTYLLSPFGGGGQAKKTIEGLRAYNQGGSLTDSGRMRYPIEQTPANQWRTGLFGQYSTPEARDYFGSGASPLGPNQTAAVLQSEDPQADFERFMFQRKMDSIADQIKAVAQDQSLNQTEKDKRIAELRDKIFELRAAQ